MECGSCSSRDLWGLCRRSTSGLYRWLAPQSPIVYSPYAADGSLKSKENLELGLACEGVFVQHNAGPGTLVEKKTTRPMLRVRLDQKTSGSRWHRRHHDYLYFQAMEEQESRRDNVTKQDLKNNETVKGLPRISGERVARWLHHSNHD